MRVNGWRILIDQGRPAQDQMACDVALAGEPIPTLRLFRWDPPAISLGFKQPPPAWWQPHAWKAAGLAHVERPTGGGIAFHGSDVSLSVIVPRALDLPLAVLMRAVCASAVEVCRAYEVDASPLLDVPATARITYCLGEVSSYAVTINGKKVAGFALRRYPQTWLIQGSLLVRTLPTALARAIPATVRSQLQTRAISLAEAAQRPVHEADVVEEWSRHWPAWWGEITSLRVQGSGFWASAPSPEPPAQSPVAFGHF